MSTASQKIRDRIRALREKTAARGCTEAETSAAAEKAAQMMRDHGLSEADIIMTDHASPSGRGRSIKAKLWPVIGRCTNTSEIIIQDFYGAEVQFVGRAPGPEIAVYLREVCEGAIDRAVREFKASTFYKRRRDLKSKRAAVADFTDGMVIRLRYRLVEVFASTIDEVAKADADKALAERYPQMGTIKAHQAPLRHNDARAAGWRAGEKVTLAHGVGASDAPLQIGGAS